MVWAGPQEERWTPVKRSRVPEATAGQGAPQGQGEHCDYQADGMQTVQAVILLGQTPRQKSTGDGESGVSGNRLVIGGSNMEEHQDLGLEGQCVGFYSPCHLSRPCPL